jgi:hypothetical protein
MTTVQFSPYKTYRVVEIDEYTWEVWGYGDKNSTGTYHDPELAAKRCKHFEDESRDNFMRSSWGKAKPVTVSTKEK